MINGASIINISSIASKRGSTNNSAYCATKFGMNGLTQSLAKELGRWGIRCNAVAPGFIDTESTHLAVSSTALKHVEDNTPLRRLGRAADVAKAVISLIENDFINGEVLRVDGGLRI